jgi:hypothetical protein
MRAIIIEEDRFTDLTDALRLRERDACNTNTAERLGWPPEIWKEALNQARREMHFEFVRWAQSHGASCVRK